MDRTLEHAWKSASAPFDGSTVYLPDLLPIDQLAEVLTDVVQALQSLHKDSDLLTFNDWHEHDGYVTASRPVTWQQVREMISTPAALYQQRPGDDFVQTAIYNANLNFLLRIYVPADDDNPDQYPGRWGSFDVTGSPAQVRLVAACLAPKAATVSPAKPYFDTRYAG